MSAQPWQRSGATVYQLTDDGTQNLWSAHVNGPKSSYADDCKTAQKMAAAQDMYEALKRIAEGNLGPAAWQADYEKIREVARAALAKARGQ